MDNNDDINILSIPKGKKLILEKININDFPEYKKRLKNLFEEPSNYFNDDLGNKKIRIGKLHQSENAFLTKKLLTKKHRYSMSQTNYDISTISEKVDKKFNKIKKRYINDYEIDEIFNKFKKHKKNSKINLTAQNTFFNSTANSRERTKTKNNTSNINKTNNNKDIKWEITPNKAKKIDFLKTSDYFYIKTPKKIMSNKNIKLFNLKDYINKVIKKNKNSKFFQLHKNIPACLLKTSDSIINRNNLLASQSQYLTSIKNNETCKKELKNALISQEIAFLFQKEKEQKFSILCDYLSQILKRPLNNLIINNSYDFRLESDIKNKIQINLNSYFPEKKYSWKNDLRKNSSTQEILDKLKNGEILREMKLKECCYSNDEKILKKKQIKKINYLKERLPKENVDNLVNNINSVFKNYDDLVVNGKNLYKVEYDICKNIKGRKIINYFEDFIKDEEKNDKLFARNLTQENFYARRNMKI